MKRIIKLFSIIALLVMVSSCVKEGYVCYRFEIHNATDVPIKVHMSSWGGYAMYINGVYDSGYKFHEVESIKAHSELIFSTQVGDNPDPYKIPLSLTPGWMYVTAIECNGVIIPAAYFTNRANWEIGVGHQLNGIFTYITLTITPDIIEQFRH